MRAGLSTLTMFCVLAGSSVSSDLSLAQSVVALRAGQPGEPSNREVVRTMPISAFANLPLQFEENRGQASRETRFLARGAGYTLLLERDGLQLNLSQVQRISMRLVDAQTVTITGQEPNQAKTNYYIGNDPAGWHLDVPSYGSVAYAGIYKGIDLIYHGNGRQLEYDFVVAPHADPGQVRMRFAGQKLEPQGEDLAFEGVDGLRVKALKAYQWVDGNKKTVAASWRIQGDEASIHLGPYDSDRELVIDPIFFYGTYIGGDKIDAAVSIVQAAQPGYYYVALSTNSDLITQPDPGAPANSPNNGGTDTLILGINATNAPPSPSPLPPFATSQPLTPSLVINSVTYLGGQTGITQPTNMVGDKNSNLYITGTTDTGTTASGDGFRPSKSQPCLKSCGGFVAKFATSIDVAKQSATLKQEYAFGLPAVPMAIAVDDLGDAYLTGSALAASGKETLTIPSADKVFQNVAAPIIGSDSNLHAFLLELDPAGTTLFCSYIGGNGSEYGNAITVAGDSVFVAGQTTSSKNFPSTSGAYQLTNHGGQDGFVLGASKLSSVPNLDFSTYLGGSGTDTVASIAIGPSGNVVIAGSTDSANFPTQHSPSFSYLSWPVVNHDTQDGSGQDFQVPELPTLPPNLVPLPTAVSVGAQDAFVTSLSADGSHLLFTDFLGNTDAGDVTVGQAVKVDDVGVIYVTGSSQGTNTQGPGNLFLPGAAIVDLDPGFNANTPSPPYQRIFFSEIDPTGHYLLEATIAGGFGVDEANDLAISGPLATTGTVSIVGSTKPGSVDVYGSGNNHPNFLFDAAQTVVDAIADDATLLSKESADDTTGFFVQEALAGFCSMQLTAQAGTVLTFTGPCVSGTQSGVLYASLGAKQISAPVAVTPSGTSRFATVTIDVSSLGVGTPTFTFAFLPLGAIRGVGTCTNGTVFLQNCGIVTAGGGVGTLFKITSGAVTVALACPDANCKYNDTPNTVLVGQPVTLTAAVTNALPGTVTWTSSQGIFSGPNPANSITFTPSGAGGPVVIQASPVANPSLPPAAITLNTIGAAGGSTSLAIIASASKMVAGTTFQFTSNQPVTWTATAGTISSSGQFMAPNPPPVPASITITATSQSDTSKTATTQVTVFTQPTLVVPSTNTLPAGGSVTIPLSITAGTGIPGESLSFNCAPATLPTGVSCTFSPNPFTNAGSGQLVLQLSSSIVGEVTPMRLAPWKRFSLGGSSMIFAALLWMRRRPRWSHRYRLFTVGMVLTFLMAMSACGTSGAFNDHSRQGHLTGTYTVNINVSGATPGAADLGQTVATAPLSVTLQ